MNKKIPTRNADLMIGAEHLYSTYYEYVKAGFTEDQALELIVTILSTSMWIQDFHRPDKNG